MHRQSLRIIITNPTYEIEESRLQVFPPIKDDYVSVNGLGATVIAGFCTQNLIQ